MTNETKRKQRWLLTRERVGQGAAIVVSILIAFAIDAAWQESQEQEELRAALVTLAGDLEQSLPMVDETASRLAGDLVFLRQAMDMPSGKAEDLPVETLGGVLEAMVRPNTADNNSIAILAALEDDRLDRLEDAALRSAAVHWRQSLVEVQERGTVVSRAEGEAFLLIGTQPDAARVFAAYQGSGPISQSLPPEALDELMATPRVRALVARRIVWGASQLRETRGQREAAAELLNEVRRILATL